VTDSAYGIDGLDFEDEAVRGSWSRAGSLKVPPIEGTVTALHRYSEKVRSLTRPTQHVVEFTVERQDSLGRPLPAIAIQMRGHGFAGDLTNGDRVRLPGRIAAGTTLRIERLANMTTEAAFGTQGPPLSSVILGLGAVVLCALVVLSFLAHFLLNR
jgi:hypothetical protein